MKSGILSAFLLLTFCAPADAEDNVDTDANLERAQDYTQRFYDEDLDHLWDHFTDPLKEAFGNKKALEAFRNQIRLQLGEEKTVLDESFKKVGGIYEYSRMANFKRADAPIRVFLALEQDRIAGFSIAPPQQPAASDFGDYTTRTPLRLPFEGEWLVFWGGRSVEDNYDAVFHAGRAGEGLPAQFLDYFENGKPVQRGEPRRGQFIRPED